MVGLAVQTQSPKRDEQASAQDLFKFGLYPADTTRMVGIPMLKVAQDLYAYRERMLTLAWKNVIVYYKRASARFAWAPLGSRLLVLSQSIIRPPSQRLGKRGSMSFDGLRTSNTLHAWSWFGLNFMHTFSLPPDRNCAERV